MPSPLDPRELEAALADAQELARQRGLALDLRDARLQHRLERALTAARHRSRRSADLLRLADAIADSRSTQRDYVLQPKELEASAKAVSDATPERTKA